MDVEGILPRWDVGDPGFVGSRNREPSIARTHSLSKVGIARVVRFGRSDAPGAGKSSQSTAAAKAGRETRGTRKRTALVWDSGLTSSR